VVLSINDKAKVRRSTRSLVLGKASVMSYEDIKEARAKRAVKDATKGKGKRGRKRKSNVLDPEPEPESEPGSDPELEPELEPEVARAAKEDANGTAKRARKRKSVVPEAEQSEPEPERMPVSEMARRTIAPEGWSAPVARMY
jgi:hypothetical protein